MKITPMESVTFILLFLMLYFAHVIGNSGAKTSTKFNPFSGNYKPHLISFNSDGGEIDVSIYILQYYNYMYHDEISFSTCTDNTYQVFYIKYGIHFSSWYRAQKQ